MFDNILNLFRINVFFVHKWKILLSKLFFRVNKDLKMEFDGNVFVAPPFIRSIHVLEEVFVDDFYSNLKGLQHVLDIGGYLGDTAVYFSKYNQNVTVYEADPANFIYCQLNCQKIPNISCNNYGITGESCVSELTFYTDRQYSMGGTTHFKNGKTSYSVEAKFFGDLLKENQYDGLKLDIEGGEYGIVEYMITHGVMFDKGYVEFHGSKEETESVYSWGVIKKFILYLERAGYTTGFYDIYSRSYTSRNAIENKFMRNRGFTFMLYFTI